MRRNRPPRALAFGIFLLSVRCATATAETWPTRLGESDKVCLASLRDADAVVRNPNPEARKGLWEVLRATLDECDRPEVDARFTARAIRLSLILPEMSTPESEIEPLTRAVSLLEKLPEPPPELVHVLDALSGSLCLLGHAEESRITMQKAADLRERIFGEKSLEAAKGKISLAHFYAGGQCSGKPPYVELARALAFEAVKQFSGCGDDRLEYLETLSDYAGVLDTLGRKEAADELGTLFYSLLEDARSKAGVRQERWDEPLPEP